MNKALLLGGVFLLAPAIAAAADLAPAPRSAPVPVMAQYNPWAGFYGGLSVGWNWGGSNGNVWLPQAEPGGPGFVGDVYRGETFLLAQNAYQIQTALCGIAPFGCSESGPGLGLPGVAFNQRTQHQGGAVITLNTGYNWQFGSFVLGVEGDLSAMNRRLTRDFAGSGESAYQFDYDGFLFIPDSQANGLYTIDSELRTQARMHWLSTARLRAGYAAGPFLLYATGGLAGGSASLNASGSVVETFRDTLQIGDSAPRTVYTATSTTTWRGSSDSKRELGWALGGGVEWMTGNGFSLKAEYLYYDLGDQTLIANGTTTTTTQVLALPPQTTTTAAAPIRIRQNLDGHIFRVGFNFGFAVAPKPIAPVVAAY